MTKPLLHRTIHMKYNIERLRVLTLREIEGTLSAEEGKELEGILRGSDEALKIWSQVYDDLENGDHILPATLKRHTPPVFAWLISVMSRKEPMRWVALFGIVAFKAVLFYMLGWYVARDAAPAPPRVQQHQQVVVARSAAAV